MALRRQLLLASPLLQKCSHRQQQNQPVMRYLSSGWGENQNAHKEAKSSRSGGTWKEEERHKKRQGQSGNNCDEAANAYEVLGLSESSSDEQIRTAFRKLAKATHPDLQTDTSTARFIRILAAYEILSDPSKRAAYDKLLRMKSEVSRSKIRTSSKKDTSGYDSKDDGSGEWSYSSELGQKYPGDGSAEVVSWLRGYRSMVKEAVSRRQLGVGKGWEEALRGEVQSALKKAYFGPAVSEREGLPECFEAEERAQRDLEDVLHLVSGRHLFGVVRQVQKSILGKGRENDPVSLLQHHALESRSDGDCPDLSSMQRNASTVEHVTTNRSYHSPAVNDLPQKTRDENPYVDLELQLFGNVVARAIRMPSTEMSDAASSSAERADGLDDIYVYLSSEQVEEPLDFVDGRVTDESRFSRTLLGSIRGLGSASGVQNVCFAHAPDGSKMHLILQHSTPMVKHMQWFRVGSERAACECRCRRASVLPSRYWLFEPRTETHNVGGWYIEMFDPSRRSQRSTTGLKARETNSSRITEQLSNLLHPAMYIMAAAYKTLDEEENANQRHESSLSRRIKKIVDVSRITSGLAGWWRR